MEPNSTPGFISAVTSMLGGGATALLGAISGRLMWHVSEVRRKRRALFSWTLVWELPIAFGMAFIGDGAGEYLELSQTSTVGLIALLSYLGPRGVVALEEQWAERGRGGSRS